MEPSRLRLDIQNIVTFWLIAALGYAGLILLHTLVMGQGGMSAAPDETA
jgi:hypothetical protein